MKTLVGSAKGQVLYRQCVSVAKVRQAEIHDDPVCTAPSLDVAPSMDLAVRLQVEVEESKAHTAGLRSDGRHGQRHPCVVARAVTFCELVQGLCCKAEQARSKVSQPAGKKVLT